MSLKFFVPPTFLRSQPAKGHIIAFYTGLAFQSVTAPNVSSVMSKSVSLIDLEKDAPLVNHRETLK